MERLGRHPFPHVLQAISSLHFNDFDDLVHNPRGVVQKFTQPKRSPKLGIAEAVSHFQQRTFNYSKHSSFYVDAPFVSVAWCVDVLSSACLLPSEVNVER